MEPERRSTFERGREAEAEAAAWLEERGWTVLERNVRAGRNEVDLVIERGRVVAFVEVKSRRSDRYGHPLESVDARTRTEIARVARAWIRRNRIPGDRIFRFDVVYLLGTPEARTIGHVEDAWRGSG